VNELRSLADIDWANWTPQQRATLMFVVRDGQMLLIHKKRGLGAGKINGPGGRIEPGETPREAAIRETQEELRVTPRNVQAGGELFFQFVDGLSLHVHVFRADGCDGDPEETDEATPVWVKTQAIPYGRMWEDDPYWLPLMLEGKPFRGFFLFDGDRLLDWRLSST
jgi:8-oxo-dGTP diphosphatase